MSKEDEKWMRLALLEAQKAVKLDEVPVGAVIVSDGQCVAAGHNLTVQYHDPSAHAEVQVLRAAGQVRGNYRLLDATLYVTLEPCLMCLGAMVHARIKRVVFGAYDPKTGVLGSAFSAQDLSFLNHQLEVEGGVLAEECGEILRHFFKRRR